MTSYRCKVCGNTFTEKDNNADVAKCPTKGCVGWAGKITERKIMEFFK